MKTILFNADSKMYQTPEVSEIKVNVERGFASSSEDPDDGYEAEVH